MFTSNLRGVPGFPIASNDPEDLKLPRTVEDKSYDKGKSSTVPPSGSGDEADTDTSTELVSAWMDNLKTLTVVTTFFVSMDSQLLSLTGTSTHLSLNASQTSQRLVYCCLTGAYIFHVCAAITAYVASFALIRYRIVDASPGEGVLGSQPNLWTMQFLRTHSSRKIIIEPIRPFEKMSAMLSFVGRFHAIGFTSRSQTPPLSLLKRCYYTTLCQTAVGFILALTGVLSYAWAGLSIHVGGFSTACLGMGIATGLWAIAS
ncbi:hypothetical protein J3A83DRAFT_4086085 [Scleroderma citrinum]